MTMMAICRSRESHLPLGGAPGPASDLGAPPVGGMSNERRDVVYKLKRCPFCGGEANLWENGGRYGYFAYCECSICSASSKSFTIGRDLPDNWGDTNAAKRAVDSWNRRCSDAEQDH